MDAQTFEQQIGINTFFTSGKGIEGTLRDFPEDFQVTEQTHTFQPNKDGRYLIVRITANNWDTHLLVRALSNKLHISRKRISFAGTKDKRALSTQYMSIENITEEQLERITLKDTTINHLCRSDQPIRIGNLLGNRFEILIRNISKNITKQTIQNLLNPIEAIEGFPNYYGIQRFGAIRPNTHVIGRLIIQGAYEKAVMNYIANPHPAESEETFAVRKHLQESYDFAYALKTYPQHLVFERSILNYLVKKPDDFIGALQTLPKNLLTLFINAYQSYLFNQILSHRITQKQPLNQALEGDLILPVRHHIIEMNPIPVTQSNINKINKQLNKHKAVVSGLLFGYNTIYAKGSMGELEQHIIEQEHLDPHDFIIPEIPYLSSQGLRRSLLGIIYDIHWSLRQDTFHTDKQALCISFELLKGSYATVFLRELMKAKDIKNY